MRDLSRHLFEPSNDHITERGIDLAQSRTTMHLLARKQRASTTAKEVDNDVSGLCTAFERLLMEAQRLLGGMFVLVGRVTLREPNIEDAENVVMRAISRVYILIHDLVEICDVFVEIRFTDRSIYARLVRFIERHLRSHIEVVLDPQTHASILHSVLREELLKQPRTNP